MHIQSLTGEWQFHKSSEETWLSAHVPGGVHTDLMALDLIPDPFVADNEKRVMWVAESDWVYRHTFTADTALMAEQHIFLVCDGLDTLAEVTLNGRRLGETDNMFRQYTWDVKTLLHEGENELVILFRSPVQYITAKQAERPLHGVSQAIEGGPYLRKAPCQFGWDWGPQLPPIGIWKDIRLEGRSYARMTDVHLQQQHNNGAVTVTATVAIEQWESTPLRMLLRVTSTDGTEQHAQVAVAGDSQTIAVRIDNPQLWWPNGYGEQPLYTVNVLLLAEGIACDTAHYQLGLRTLELRREPDTWGVDFSLASSRDS